jgi:predicted Holliday junction resolvase-like endonuclease
MNEEVIGLFVVIVISVTIYKLITQMDSDRGSVDAFEHQLAAEPVLEERLRVLENSLLPRIQSMHGQKKSKSWTNKLFVHAQSATTEFRKPTERSRVDRQSQHCQKACTPCCR